MLNGNRTNIQIAPSILSADFSRLAGEIAVVESAGADMIHFDVMDGHFVPNITIGPGVCKDVRGVTELPIDAHLMITDPEQYAPRFVDAGAHYITFHTEVCNEPEKVIDKIRCLGARPGIAVNPNNPAEWLKPFIGLVDLVLVMTVEPGFGGQSFMAEVMPKLAQVAQWRDEEDLDFLLEVDGGINRDTAATVAANGASVLVAGSAIFRSPDPAGELVAIRESALLAAEKRIRS